MRFYFDIDDSLFCDEYGIEFSEEVKRSVIQCIADNIYDTNMSENWYSTATAQINQIIKERSNDIVESIVERVADKIAKKKAVVALTPKASELTAADKENVEYFEAMIDKAIAKRFGK